MSVSKGTTVRATALWAALSLALAASSAALAAGAGPAVYGDPAAAEQYMLEVINAMRADPNGAAATYGISLNEGLTAGTISSSPKQPLAMNADLLAAARGHSQDMLIRDFFDHVNPDGLTPSQRAEEEGYSPFVGENIALSSVSGMTEAQGVEYLLELLFVDEGISGRGHRVNLLRSTFSEVGIGFRRGDYQGWDVYVATQDFGSDSSPFVTGVCYSDINGNGEYDMGEGLSGVTITAGLHETVTSSAGGYALAVAGSYTIFAHGNGIDTFVDNVAVTSENVKVDFTSGMGIPNGAPSVDAGTAQEVDVSDPASLSGTASDDGNPDPPGELSVVWTMTSGPGTVTFDDSSALETTATFSTAGTYILRLTATDGALSACDDVTITVTGVGGTPGGNPIPPDDDDDDDDDDDSGGGGGCFLRTTRNTITPGRSTATDR